jgi:antitoxin component HigA of HigAB toxin-antitoxin module
MEENKPTPKPTPKPSLAKKPEKLTVPIYDAVVGEDIVDVEEAPVEAVAVEVEEVVEVVSAPAVVSSSKAPVSEYAVVGNAKKDTIHVSKAVYKNINAKKSLTVHHIQRRLREWGLNDAYLDRDGWYGDLTKKSVTEFQELKGLPATGVADYATLVALFENDSNVIVAH